MVGFTLNCIQFLKIQAGAQLKPVFGGFETRLKFFKFGLRSVLWVVGGFRVDKVLTCYF